MHYTSVEYCPILQAKPRRVQSDSLWCFHTNISAILVYPKHVLLGTWPVTVLDNPLQECQSARQLSCRCMAVRRWSINGLLDFN